MSKSRIVKLSGFHEVVLGRDLSRILKDDVIYAIAEIAGVVILSPMGESARMMRVKQIFPESKYEDPRKIGQIAVDGTTYITTVEYEKEIKKNGVPFCDTSELPG